MNVKNASCIWKLSFKTLGKSMVRNIVAVLAIALTTLMITSVISVAFSFKTASNQLDSRMVGCAADAYLDDLTEDQIRALQANPRVKKTGRELQIGMFNEAPFDKKPLELVSLDQTSAAWHYVSLEEGEMPKAKDEIVLDRASLTALELPAEIGTTVTLPYISGYGELKGQRNFATFRLSGIAKGDALAPKHFACCSEEFAKEAGCRLRINMTARGNVMSLATEGSSSSVGFYKDPYKAKTGMDSYVFIGLFLALIAVSGYLIIYNIFQISVVNDISYYGLLKTIGVTGKQLKKIIRIQSLLLCLVGIPLGIGLGTLVGSFLSPSVLQSTIFSAVSDSYSYSPLIWVISAVFALITVRISCSKPGRIAAKISPVEAFKYSEVKVDTKNHKKVSGLLGMAARNMSRNKKKTVLVFLSMALPVVILSLGLSFAKNMSFEKYYSSDFAFKVSNSQFYQYDIPQPEDGKVADFVSDRDINAINSEISFERSGSVYTTAGIPTDAGDRFAVVTGVEESLYSYMNVVEGDIAPLFDPNSHAIALNENGTEITSVNVGDHIKLDYTVVTYTDTRTGEEIRESDLAGIPIEYLQVNKKSNPVEYTVCARVKLPYDLYVGYTFLDSYALVLPYEKLKNDTDGRVYRYLTVFDTPDTEKVAKAEEFIQDYCSKNGLEYRSDKTEREEFQSFGNMISRVVISLCIVLLLIGILNFANAVVTGITTRSHEFAVLKAIGMTDRQQERVLVTEGGLYCLGSILIGTIVYSIMHFPFVQMFKDLEYVDPRFSLLPMGMVAVIFLLLGGLIPYIVYLIVSRKTVVERLRINE